MKIGISLKIDVSKIDKARLFKGQKGTYLDLTTFVDLGEADKYGNHGFISQSVTKEERDAGVQTPILGNSKVFYSDSNSQSQSAQPETASPDVGDGGDFYDDDIPFN